MTGKALPAPPSILAGRRFAVRFMGRRGTWLWLLGTGVVAFAAWFLVAVPARGSASAQRTWFLWSGNVLLALFVLTMLFVARKWSIRLAYFRRFGASAKGGSDETWAAIQELNAKVRKGAFASDAEIRAAADATLRRFGTEKIERAELSEIQLGGRTVTNVELRKKEPFGRLEAWLEMHMGVGTIACIGVLLHADLVLRHPIGWALFVGSMIVLVTGVIGALLYRAIPEKLAKSDTGIPYEEAGVARENYQHCIVGVLATLDDNVRAPLAPLAEPSHSPQELVARSVAAIGAVAAKSPANADVARDLVVMAGSRDSLFFTTAEARRYDLWLRLWRWIHVPVSVALFFVIALHVWAVVWY